MIQIVNTIENNLKGLTFTIPNNKLIVITGVSGSGKSTLVNQVIFKEARRRYLETFSAGTRQLFGKAKQAQFDYISGLSPAIALEQKQKINSLRSTVGTLTELYDLLRLLFARYGSATSKDIDFKIDRNLFSFNSAKGVCRFCNGLGVSDAIDKDSLITDSSKSLREGVIKTTQPNGYIMYSQVTIDVLEQVCQAEGFSVDIPWNALTDYQKNIIWYGSNKIKVPFGKHTLESRMKWKGITAKPREEGFYKGMIPIMDEILKRDRNPSILRFTKTIICPECKGKRLNTNALLVKYNNYSIHDLANLSIENLNDCIVKIKQQNISEGEHSILNEIQKTIKLIMQLGLGFLKLTRSSESLSGGETQRLRLAKMVNSGLRGMLYVFDEPSVGMHHTEVESLLNILYELRDQGNTVIVVEHNNQVIRHCEWIIDLGPVAGKNGGELLFNGSIDAFLQNPPDNSKTAQFLKPQTPINNFNSENKEQIELRGINYKDFTNTDINFILNGINVITGKSGSGKSVLINQVLAKYFNGDKEKEIHFESISGHESIKKLIIIDQSPIGKTLRSNPATYTGLADELRNLFAKLPEAKSKGLTKSHFSFNTKQGRCPKCEGAGYLQFGMHTLGTLESVCDACSGKQFQSSILEIKYKEKSLADIYAMDIDEACVFFEAEQSIIKHLKVMHDLGIGYLKLNQRSSTLSGGEARRIKLARDLVNEKAQPTLYLIDEPSTGLHSYDILTLIKNFQKLIDQGHTIVLSEQNDLFLKNANWVIELGKIDRKNSRVLFSGISGDYPRPKRNKKIELPGFRSKQSIENLTQAIAFSNVCTHNLKQVNVEFPANKLIVVTGVSGSGKSSLIFDTLFTEGRQKYTECFSTYVRNRLNINSQAKYEHVKGLFPTVAIDQNNYAKSERSTVGTMTDIYSQLRILFSRAGKNSYNNNVVLSSQFSFNHEHGACTLCEGLGYNMDIDGEKLVSNPELSIAEGAMHSCKPGNFYTDVNGQYYAIMLRVAMENGIELSKPWKAFSKKEKDIVLNGTGDLEYDINWSFKRKNREGNHQFRTKWQGLIYYLKEEYLRKINDKRVDAFEPILTQNICKKCAGTRLNSKALEYTIAEKNIHQLNDLPITQLSQFFRENLQKPQQISNDLQKQKAAFIIIGAIMRGLDVLEKLGLGYLSLSRRANTLSGGEGQRVRLASVLVHDLSGVCFVLDEPSLGLHPKDSHQLVMHLKDLVGQGNTVVVSEHDPYFAQQADHVIEIGPKAGKEGGEIVAAGTFDDLMGTKRALSSKYFRKEFRFEREKRNINLSASIKIEGAYANNLKHINLDIPTNVLVGIKGVSGSGKSSLVRDVIYKSFTENEAVNCKLITGLEKFRKVIWVNQSSLKAGGQSYVASKLAYYDKLKKPFVKQPLAKELKLSAKHFSLNGKDGCCPDCKGKGIKTTALDFLSNIDEVCESCNGQRFDTNVLSCKWNNLSIADVMNLQLKDLGNYYDDKWIKNLSKWSDQMGLGYISSGQMLKTLSGGELQRIKLLQSMLDSEGSNYLYLFDEPTMGLHLSDVEKLISGFNILLQQGQSIIFIEHNTHLLDCADFLIEIGPGAGEKGGKLV